ncbi:LytTR family DNA-binding domain-containing protein [Streptococcus sp. NLN64]|uniref:LytTR family DNA-binding domain-containing protein n=1 Tax=Streptococcus sp. NLN64 TaxID=2822799 RepID=UPI0018CB0EA7|nr:LytTR family DNA-binding domain-containing protein [Streptococcus sp. NLN64]MBG9367177.1 response regulator transcription factor [Streptococcus sp. NLN64]
MKVKITIDPSFSEDLVHFKIRSLTPQLSELIAYANHIEQSKDQLTVKLDQEIYFLKWREITRIYLENRILQVRAKQQVFHAQLRLYRIKEIMPPHFLQISQSEVVNLDQIKHLELTTNGLVLIHFLDGDQAYSSRRYLKTIKEVLGL